MKDYIIIKKDEKFAHPHECIEKLAEFIRAAQEGKHGDAYEDIVEGWDVKEIN